MTEGVLRIGDLLACTRHPRGSRLLLARLLSNPLEDLSHRVAVLPGSHASPSEAAQRQVTLLSSPQPDLPIEASTSAGMCSLVLGVNVRHFPLAQAGATA